MKIRCLYDKLVPISELKLNPENRNVHPNEQIERLAEILKYQGWRYCVKVSNLSGMVSSGHGRVEAAILNGWKEVPVNFQDYDDSDQEYADSIADNAIASWAELNLSGIQTDIKGLSVGFNVTHLGLKGLFPEPEKLEPGCDEDEVPEKVEACEQTNRRCFMMELDPHYCDIIVARWEKYSGKKAILINENEVLNGEKREAVKIST